MDIEINTNGSLNATFEDSFVNPPFYYMELVLLLVTIPGICADGLIIYSIVKFKKMQTKTNIYILNWCISDLVFQVSTPMLYVTISKMYGGSLYYRFYCIFDEIQPMSQTLTILFVLMFHVDFIYEKISMGCHKITVIVMWIVTVVSTVTFIVVCLNNIFVVFSFLCLLLSYFILLCVHLVKCCCYVKQVRNKEIRENQRFRFVLVSTYVWMWFIGWITFFCLHYYAYYFNEIDVLISIIGHLNPIVNLFLLARMDFNYKLCFLQVLRCSTSYVNATISYNDARDDEDNINNATVADIVMNGNI